MGTDGLFKMVVKGGGSLDVPPTQQRVRMPTSVGSRSPKQSPRSGPSKAAVRVSILNSPRKVAAELSVVMLQMEEEFTAMETDGRGKWQCMVREGCFLEDWLDKALQRPTETGELKAGLQQYKLSRVQLGVMGLSEHQIDRAYRMLYVYSIGCHEMVKELCLHSLEKSLLVGCFWRAFIRLCEEHAKVGLQAEIAELMEEKQNAINELRFTRGCLNDALDGLAVKKLLEPTEEKPAAARISLKNKSKIEDLPKRESVEVRMEELLLQNQSLVKRRDELQLKVEDDERALRMERAALDLSVAKEHEKASEVLQLEGKIRWLQGALDKERFQTHNLRDFITQLEIDIAEKNRKTEDMTWKFVQYERDVPNLLKKVAEYKSHGEALEAVNHQLNQDCLHNKATVEKQQEWITAQKRQLDTYHKAVNDLKSESKVRTRHLEEKTREALLQGEEVEAWIRGHEVLLDQHLALMSQVEQLKKRLGSTVSSLEKRNRVLQTTTTVQQENLRALVVGIASLTPRRTGVKGKGPKLSLSEVVSEHQQMRDRKMSRRMSRRISRKSEMRRASEFSAFQLQLQQLQLPGIETGSSIPEAEAEAEEETAVSADQFSDGEGHSSEQDWDDLCSELSQQREELEKLEANLQEEKNRRLWLEKHDEDTVAELEKLRVEVEHKDLRIANLSLDKKNKEKNLLMVEERSRKLDMQLEQLAGVLDAKTKEIESLKATLARERQKQANCDFNCRSLLTTWVRDIQRNMDHKMQLVDARTGSMTERFRSMKARATKVATDLATLKLRTKSINTSNLVLQAELKNAEAELALSSKEKFTLTQKVRKEQLAKDELDMQLRESEKMIEELKVEQALLEAELEAARKEKTEACYEREDTYLRLLEAVSNLNALKSEREKEDAIRAILQKDVDALRLQIQALKRERS